MVTQPPSSRADLALRIVEAALEQFGRVGFDGASTRSIARVSGAAMSSITYHFGGKHGLYLACADHIAQRLVDVYAPILQDIRAQPAPSADVARAQLMDLVETFARFMLSERSAEGAQFIACEQQHPTEAFERIYERVMRPVLEVANGLIAIARPSMSDLDRRMLVTNVIGMVLVFRMGRACVMRTMNVDELDAVTAESLIAGLRRSTHNLLTPEPASEA